MEIALLVAFIANIGLWLDVKENLRRMQGQPLPKRRKLSEMLRAAVVKTPEAEALVDAVEQSASYRRMTPSELSEYATKRNRELKGVQ